MPLMSEHAARQLSGLQLAFIGDTVCDLLARTEIIFEGRSIKDMHAKATGIVNARAQAQALAGIEHLLTEEESGIVRRAHNAHIKHNVPKSATHEEYLSATAYEALMGYLYLTGQMHRAQMLFKLGFIKE